MAAPHPSSLWSEDFADVPRWRSSRELLRAVKPCNLERSRTPVLSELTTITETWPRLLPTLLSGVLVGGSNVPHLKHGLSLSKGVELLQRARLPVDSLEEPPPLVPTQLVALVNSVSWAQEKVEARWTAFKRLQERLAGRASGVRIEAPKPGAQGIGRLRGDPRPGKNQDLEILRGLTVDIWFDEDAATSSDLFALCKLKKCVAEPYRVGVFEEPMQLELADFELLEGCWDAAGLKDCTKAWVARKFLEYWEKACIAGPHLDVHLIHRHEKLWVESPPLEGRVAQRLSARAATSLLLGSEELFPLSFRMRFLEQWVDLDGDCTELTSLWLEDALAALIPDPAAIAREGPARDLLKLVSRHQGLVAALLDYGARGTGRGLVATLLLRGDIDYTACTPLQATTCRKIIACLAAALKSKGTGALSAVERETLSSFLRSGHLSGLKLSTSMLLQSQDGLLEIYAGLLHCYSQASNEGAQIELTKRLLMLYAAGEETLSSAQALAPTGDRDAVVRGRRRPDEVRHSLPRLLTKLLEVQAPTPYLTLRNFSANCAMLIQKKFFHSWLPPTFRVRLYEWTMDQVDTLFALTGADAEGAGMYLSDLSHFFSSVALPAFRVNDVLQLWRRLTVSVDSWSFLRAGFAAIQKDSRFQTLFLLARTEIDKRVAALGMPKHDQVRLDPQLTPELLGRRTPAPTLPCGGVPEALRAMHEVYDVLTEVLRQLDSAADGDPRADWIRATQRELCPWRFRAEKGQWAMRKGDSANRMAGECPMASRFKKIPFALLPTDLELELSGSSSGPQVPELSMSIINDSLHVTRAFYLSAIFHEKHSQMERLKSKDDCELLKNWLDSLNWEPVLRSCWIPSFSSARRKTTPGQHVSTGATEILLRFVDLLSLRWSDPKEAMHRCARFWDLVSSARDAISKADVEPANARRYELLRLMDWREELRRSFLQAQAQERSLAGWAELRSWAAWAQNLGSDSGGQWGPKQSREEPSSGCQVDVVGLLLVFAKKCPHLSGAMIHLTPGQAVLPSQQPAAAAVAHTSKNFVLERCRARQMPIATRWNQKASRVDLRKSAEQDERLGQDAPSRWEASSVESNLRLLVEHCSSVEEMARVFGRGALAAANILDLDTEEKLDGLKRRLDLAIPLEETQRPAYVTAEVKRLAKDIAGVEKALQKMRFRRSGVAVLELLDFLVMGERLVLEERVRREKLENTKLLQRFRWWSLRTSCSGFGRWARRPTLAEEAARREREVLIRLGMLAEEERASFRSVSRSLLGCFRVLHGRLQRAAREAFLRSLRQKPLAEQIQIVKDAYPLETSGTEEKLPREDADRILGDFVAEPSQATVSRVLELIRASAGTEGTARHRAFLQDFLRALKKEWSIQKLRPDNPPPLHRKFRTVLAGLAELLGTSELKALCCEEDLFQLWRRCGAAIWENLMSAQSSAGTDDAALSVFEEGVTLLTSFLSVESPEGNFEAWGARGLEADHAAEPLAGLPCRLWGLLDFSQVVQETTALKLLTSGHHPIRPTRGLRRSVFCGFSAETQAELIKSLFAQCGHERHADQLLLLAEFVPLLSTPVLSELQQLFFILRKLVSDPREEARPAEDVLSSLATEGLERHERQASGWSRVMQVLLRGLRDRAQGLHLESAACWSDRITVSDLMELHTGDWARRLEFLLPLHDLAAVSPNWLHSKEQEVLFRFCLTSLQKVPVEGDHEGEGHSPGRYQASPLLNSTNCQYLCNLFEGKAVDPNHVSSLVSSVLCDEEFENIGGPAVSLVKETALRAMMRLGNEEKKAVVQELMAPITEAMLAEGSGGQAFVRLSPYTLFALSVVDIGSLDLGWLDGLSWYVERLVRLSEDEVQREKEIGGRTAGKPVVKYATIRMEKLENLIRDANPLKVNQVHTFPRSAKIQKLLCPRFLNRFQEDAARGDHRFFRLFLATAVPKDIPGVLLSLLDRQLLRNNAAAEQLIFDSISSARVRNCITAVQFRGFLEHIPDSQIPARMDWVSRMVAPRASGELGPEAPLSRVSSLGSDEFELVIVSDRGIVTAEIDESLVGSPARTAGSGAAEMLREFLEHLLERRHRGSLGLLAFSLNNAVDGVGSLLKTYSSMSRGRTQDTATEKQQVEMLVAVKTFLLELNVAMVSEADRIPVSMPPRLRSLWASFLKLYWSQTLDSAQAAGPDELERELRECLPTVFRGCEAQNLQFIPLTPQEIQEFAELPGPAIRRMLTRADTPLGTSARQSALSCFGQAIMEDLVPLSSLTPDDPPSGLTEFLRSLNEKEFGSLLHYSDRLLSKGKDRAVARVVVKSLIHIISEQHTPAQSRPYFTPAHVLGYACRALCMPLNSTTLGTSFVDDAEVDEAAVLLKQIYSLCDSFTRRQMRLQAAVGAMMWARKGDWMQAEILDKM